MPADDVLISETIADARELACGDDEIALRILAESVVFWFKASSGGMLRVDKRELIRSTMERK